VRFVNLGEEVTSGSLDSVLASVSAEVEAHQPGIVVVDSFRSVALTSDAGGRSERGLQRFVQALGVLMASWQATTFLVGDYSNDDAPNPVYTVADGLLWLRQSVQGNSMVRKLQVVKMRGQATLPGLHTFRISHSGLQVFAPPPTGGDDGGVASDGRRLSMGVTGLDAMLGGGLPPGYSVLVAGPSGSGKSLMAAAFLLEGARCGETGVIAAFEQRPNRSRGQALAALIASGRPVVVDTRASALSVDEIAMLLMTEITRLGATRVVIDSLSGFALALAPTFRDDDREALSRMVSALARTGATVLMTSELEDRYTDLRFSPYGTAFLTDAIIVQRYVEIDSRLRGVMAVVKVRASAHSDALHLFHIDDAGIHVDAPLAGHDGLLGGQPTRGRVIADD